MILKLSPDWLASVHRAQRMVSSLALSAMLPLQRNTRPAAADQAPEQPGDEQECRRSMLAVIEDQIIPRLLQAHRIETQAQPSNESVLLSAAVIRSFAMHCAEQERDAAGKMMKILQAEGLSVDSLFMELITPAARHLGSMWESDEIGFSAVTIGLGVMQEIIHDLGYEYRDGPQQAGHVKRVMLACAPGSQHLLGLVMVSEFFRKAGWQVVLETSPTRLELRHAVRNEWFDLIGLSVATQAQLGSLSSLVQELRAESHNPGAAVLLGGPIFSYRDQPLNAAHFGADSICSHAGEALTMAAALVDR